MHSASRWFIWWEGRSRHLIWVLHYIVKHCLHVCCTVTMWELGNKTHHNNNPSLSTTCSSSCVCNKTVNFSRKTCQLILNNIVFSSIEIMYSCMAHARVHPNYSLFMHCTLARNCSTWSPLTSSPLRRVQSLNWILQIRSSNVSSEHLLQSSSKTFMGVAASLP